MPILKHLSIVILFFFCTTNTSAQQFNSDSWISKPHGMVTLIPTAGQRSSMIMNTFSLIPKWEFTVAAYIYNDDGDISTADGYSTTFYAKYMFYENKAQTGGAAVKFGTGMRPGTLDPELRVKDAFRTYWTNFPCTIPFFDNKLSWDIMPGASYTFDYDGGQKDGFSFTYSTRIAYYPFSMKYCFVGEVFGSKGSTGAIPEYKFGLRWEPSQYVVFAISYGQEFNGNNGAGFEIGAMLFSPPFLCFKGCNKNTEKPAM
jgi:hypothetical protein